MGHDLVGGDDPRVPAQAVEELRERPARRVAQGVEAGPNFGADALDLVEPRLVDFVGGEVGGCVVVQAGLVEPVAIRQPPDAVPSRRKRDLFIEPGDQALVRGDHRGVDGVLDVEEHLLSFGRAQLGDLLDPGLEFGVERQVLRAAGSDVADLVGGAPEERRRGNDPSLLGVVELADQTGELVIHLLETADVVLGVLPRLQGVFVREIAKELDLPAEAVGHRVEVVHELVLGTPRLENPGVGVEADLLLVTQ